jgi:hypothetical protein
MIKVMSVLLRFDKLPSFIRFLIAVVLAILTSQFLAHFAFGPSKSNWTGLKSAFSNSNTILSQGPIAVNKSIPTPADWKTVSICLWGTWPLDGALKCQDEPPKSERKIGYPALGYTICCRDAGDPHEDRKISRAFFYVDSFPFLSGVKIKASLETMLRDTEALAFNGPKASDVDLKLCSGTRELADSTQCMVTARIREVLSKEGSSIDYEINRIRMISLFLGFFQLLTSAIFFSAMLETGALWARWVAPQPSLFSIKVPDGTIDPTTVANLSGDKISAFLRSGRPSIGDRIFFQGLLAAAQYVEGGRADFSQSPPDSGTGTAAESKQIRIATVVERLAVFRQHLLDDAQGLIERLETLGDTMLKLAFMGTVFGISSALFSARGLDTADPVLRLLAKSEMYSGIGVGFGTTLTGIILSIIAAQARSSLFETWTGRIGRSFERVLDFGSGPLIEKAVNLELHEHPENWASGTNVIKPSKISVYEIAGWLVIVGAAIFLVLRLASLL